ncbi:MAG: hypothetical protein K2K84_07400 [Muribaculaceae bacterium]|nr:hypothetical protein [Muribaculaceae bacterium]
MINRRFFLRFWGVVLTVLCIVQISFSTIIVFYPTNKDSNFIYETDTIINGNDTLLTVYGRPDSSVINEYYRTESGFYLKKTIVEEVKDRVKNKKDKGRWKGTIYEGLSDSALIDHELSWEAILREFSNYRDTCM